MRSKNIGGRVVEASLDESVITSMKGLEKMLIKIAESSKQLNCESCALLDQCLPSTLTS